MFPTSGFLFQKPEKRTSDKHPARGILSGALPIFGLYLNPDMRPIYCYFFIFSLTAVSCVSNGTYKALQVEKSKSDSLYTWAMGTLKASQDDNARLSRDKAAQKDSIYDLNLQLGAVKQNNSALHKQLDEISAISTAQAESIRKSIDNIGAKDEYLQRLRMAFSQRDSANLAVLMEIKAAMGSFNDSLVGIRLAQGVVTLTVSNQLLFGDDSTNYTVTDKGKNVLVRLARVLRDQPDIGCRVEAFPGSAAMGVGMAAGVDSAMRTDSLTRTDSLMRADSLARTGLVMSADSLLRMGLAMHTDSGMDSWALDVRRAASVVRMLQNQYNIPAARLTAAGRGEFGRGTRIVLIPPTDRLTEVLEKK
jgi:chemotaxis protein MotB